MILDKTGTLTYGRPSVSEELYAPPFDARDGAADRGRARALQPASAAPRRSCTRRRRRAIPLPDVEWIREEAGVGLHGKVGDTIVLVTSRAQAAGRFDLPPAASRPASSASSS